MAVYDIQGNLLAEKNSPLVKRRPYWILLLDVARKKYSQANLKTIIDKMAEKGLNQLIFHFATDRAFRFQLNDMLAVDTDGNEFDLSPCLSTDASGCFTEAEVDEIIMYARAKGIDVVPSLNMPGHMSMLLQQFPQFKYYDNYYATLDATNPAAVKFALAVVYKYASYFASRGCTYWNIGSDEIGSNGRWNSIPSADVPYFVTFINTVAEFVTNMGFTPRAFNDGVLYGGSYSCLFNKNIEILDWASAELQNDAGIQNIAMLVKNGYKLINANYDYYFITPRDNSKTSNPAVENANILKVFKNGTTTYDHDGACICVWSDNDTVNDGGNAALSSILADITSLGIGIQLALADIDYPIIDY